MIGGELVEKIIASRYPNMYAKDPVLRTLRYRYHKSLPPALYPWALARLYKRAIGQKLNLKTPRTFTENAMGKAI